MAPRHNDWAYKIAKQHDLKSGERNVFLVLAHHRNKKTGMCFPSVETLSDFTGLHRRTVQRHLKALSAKGVITVKAQYKRNTQQTNRYGFPPLLG